jgi:hypothetical protein
MIILRADIFMRSGLSSASKTYMSDAAQTRAALKSVLPPVPRAL